jgi:hypothetical protein
MARWPGTMPTLFGVIQHGRFAAEPSSIWDDLVVVCRAEGAAVIKPVNSSHGDGVRILDAADGTLTLDGRPVSEDEVRALPRSLGHAIVQEKIRGAEYARRINPHSLNTIRILTLRAPDTRKVFIAAAAHRFGTKASGQVDNWSAQGLAAHIDVDSGVLGSACSSPRTRRAMRFERHPDTGEPIAGVAVPGWQGVKSTVQAWADRLPYVTYCGWDVAIDHSGRLRAIEGNLPCNSRMFQTNRPLLIDPPTRAYFRAMGVIR